MNKKCIDCEFSRQCVTIKQINSNTCLKDDSKKSMNNEIKEILEEMRFIKDRIKYYSLDKHQIELFLDYITNLQEKYNEYKNLYFSEHKVKEDYKSRNEKAIAILEKGIVNKVTKGKAHINLTELLNILEGDDEEWIKKD